MLRWSIAGSLGRSFAQCRTGALDWGITPSLRLGQKDLGFQNPTFCSLGDGQPTKMMYPPLPCFPCAQRIVFTPPPIFSLLEGLRHPKPACFARGLRPPDSASSISLNMILEGYDTDSMVMLPWKFILSSELTNQRPGGVYYFGV